MHHRRRRQIVGHHDAAVRDLLHEHTQRDIEACASVVRRHLNRNQGVSKNVRGRPGRFAGNRGSQPAVIDFLKQREIERTHEGRQPVTRGFRRKGRDIGERANVGAAQELLERRRERGMTDVEFDLTTIRLIGRQFDDLLRCSRRERRALKVRQSESVAIVHVDREQSDARAHLLAIP